MVDDSQNPPASTHTLAEDASKELLAPFGIPLAPERVVASAAEAVAAGRELGFPVVAKLCGDHIAHKTERGLVRLGLADAPALEAAAEELLALATAEDGDVGVLVAPMVKGNRELIAGVISDPQFGPCVMLGVGGILAEAIGDVIFGSVPLSDTDAHDMIDGLRTQKLLEPFRGEPALDRKALAATLLGLSAAAEARGDIVSVDLNPLIIADGKPVAVDALVELADDGAFATPQPATTTAEAKADGFRGLFDPAGVVVVGVSSHPGKFGFVSLHNILASGYEGRVFGTNRDGATVLGIECSTSLDAIPAGQVDLMFICTPKSTVLDVLRTGAARGIKAAFIASAGYGEAGPEGIAEQAELVAVAEELGVLIVGPNGQGVVSTPARLCAQIVAPMPPRGHIGVASQSGNFVSSFENWSTATGVGISRAVSAGNAAMVGVWDFFGWLATDEETKVSLGYVEGIDDGIAFARAVRAAAEAKPLVLVKGGATAGGARAAASHTGSLASDDGIFDGVAKQMGVTRAPTMEEAFEAAASFVTQPLPSGPRTVVLTSVGGWGVVSADAMADTRLELLELPDDLLAEIDEKLPPRWSKNNPIDMAGGETRDTIPELIDLVAAHPSVDAIIYLGLGIQSNQARLMRAGRFYPDHGIERIVEYHERQDARFAEAAAESSKRHDIPILVATELAISDPDNAGPAAVRNGGRLCYPSANRAVAALGHMYDYAAWRANRGL